MEREERYRVLVLGLGNLLMGDDGIGVKAARAMQDHPPEGSLVVDVGTAVLDVLPLVERSDHVVAIDAVDRGKRPGTLFRFDLNDSTTPVMHGTLHELSFPIGIRLLPEDCRPPVTVVGMQPAVIGAGLELSAAVRAAMPRLLQAVREEVVRAVERSRAADPVES